MAPFSTIIDSSWSIFEMTPLFEPLDTRDLGKLERLASEALQTRLQAKDKKGTFVQIEWLSQGNLESSKTSSSTGKHLLFSIYIDESLSSSFLLMFPTIENDHLASIELCLARKKSTYVHIWEWLEARTGCVFARKGFIPSSQEMCRLASFLSQLDRKETKIDSEEATKNFKLTFTTPKFVSEAGLETIALSVPRKSMLSLHARLDSKRPEKKTKVEGNDSEDSRMVALKRLVFEKFGIDVGSCVLSSIACHLATLSEGKLKLHQEEGATDILKEFAAIVKQRAMTSLSPQKAADSENESSASDEE